MLHQVRSKLQSLLPIHSNRDHVLHGDRQEESNSRPTSSEGSSGGKENIDHCKKLLDDGRESEATILQENSAGHSSLNQPQKIPQMGRNLEPQHLSELRSAHLESLKRISSARRVKKIHQGNKETSLHGIKHKGGNRPKVDEAHRGSISLLSPHISGLPTLANSAPLHPHQGKKLDETTYHQKETCIPLQASGVVAGGGKTVPGSSDTGAKCNVPSHHSLSHGTCNSGVQAQSSPQHPGCHKAGAKLSSNLSWIDPVGEEPMATANPMSIYTKGYQYSPEQHFAFHCTNPSTSADQFPGEVVGNGEVQLTEDYPDGTSRGTELPCSVCGRSFCPSSLKIHEGVCSVVFKKRRKVILCIVL